MLCQYVAGRAFSTGRPAIPGVIFCVEQDGNQLLVSDSRVRSGRNQRYASMKEDISGQCGYNWAYDATAADTVFAPSVPVDKPKNLIARTIEKVHIGELLLPELKNQGVV